METSPPALYHPWQLLPEHAVGEGLQRIADGEDLGFGWWRRHLHTPPAHDAPPCPPPQPPQPWEPWELALAAGELRDEGAPPDQARRILAHLSVAHQLTVDDLRAAWAAYIDE